MLPLVMLAMFFSMPLVRSIAEDSSPKPETLALWNGHAPVGDGTFQTEDAEITVHRAAHPNGAAAVICPGGGYAKLMMEPEGHGIARWLNEHGITGIVLQYRLPHGNHMVPLLDAQRALRLARSHAVEWGIDPKRIGIIGFSAGGHLASTADTHFDAGNPQASDPVERVSCRPDFAILIYPVISMGEKGHAGSRKNLLGENPTPEMIEQFSNEKHITPQTPPTFLAHAANDAVVPPDNSRMFYEALKANHVPAKYLELPSGGHGLDHYQGPMWDAWQVESIEWLKQLGFSN
jgi:acetyl esterase/lipase